MNGVRNRGALISQWESISQPGVARNELPRVNPVLKFYLKEVADELQLSEDAVGGLLRRGRQQLVERLEKAGHARVA